MSAESASRHTEDVAGAHAPIFIHGIFERSGTNYLAALLNLHPDCYHSWLHENWVLSEWQAVAGFAATMGERWRRDPAWEVPSDVEDRLARHLGIGMLSFLSAGADGARLVTKTPSVYGLERFFAVFPNAYLLILVRDGRSVVESSTRSSGHDPAQVARWWAAAADRILRFDREHRVGDRCYRIVRYEDLVRDTENQMAEILRFLHLDVARYDFSKGTRLPVFGSSATRDDAGHWKWQISPRVDDLGSVERWAGWSRSRHERFNWIAGDRLEAFGYAPMRFPSRRRLWWMLTAAWSAAMLPRRAVRRLRRRGKVDRW
jgi:hypothetical protein